MTRRFSDRVVAAASRRLPQFRFDRFDAEGRAVAGAALISRLSAIKAGGTTTYQDWRLSGWPVNR
jgi:hypothetical protein